MKGLGIVVALFVAVPFILADMPPKYLNRAEGTPDFCQTDPAGHFPDKGSEICGPVAVANSLMKLKSGADTAILDAAVVLVITGVRNYE